MTALFALPLFAIFLISAALIVIAIEAGRLLGRRSRRLGGDNVATIEAAILGLLALIIAFTVAISVSRYDARRDAILDEANAIGTTALRATLLPEPQRSGSIDLLQDYAALRLSVTASVEDRDASTRVVEESNLVLNRLWLEAQETAAQNDAMVPTGIFIESLNGLIDDQERRLAALTSRVPRILLAALYVIALVAAGFLGYSNGLEANRQRAPIYVFGLLVVAVILLIQDLDRPSEGFILVSQAPLIDAAKSLDALPGPVAKP